MKVLSFNVLCYGCDGHGWPERKDDVIEVTRRNMPDVFGIQEAHIDWMNIFIKGMPEYDYVGVGRDDGKEGGEFSAVFYKKDRFTASDSGNFWISETPDIPSKGWDAACIRVATYVKLTDKESGEAYVHFNTHLDHVGDTARIEGVKMIKEKAASFGGVPVVCTGDFNVTQGSECYNTMVSGNMADSRLLAPETDDSLTYHGFDPENIKQIIDFVFVDRDTVKPLKFKVIDEKVNGEYYSDHYAVYADIELK